MNNKKGIALVIAIIVLLGLSLMATAIMITAQSEMKIGAAHKWYVKAMDVAQAGLNEVIKRMKLPDSDANAIYDTSTVIDPEWQAVVLNTNTLPADRGDTIFYSSLQSGITPVLEYTDTAYTENALKIHYKHKDTLIYFYDQDHQKEILGPPSLSASYYPIIVAEITGRFGKAKRRIVVEMTKQSIALNVPGGLAASNVSIVARGHKDFGICGHNHRETTPWGTLASDTDTTDASLCFYRNAGKDVYHVPRPDGTPHPGDNPEVNSECALTHCIPGIITQTAAASIGRRGEFDAYGNPDILIDPNYETPDIWEVLGFSSEAEMDANIGWTYTGATFPSLYNSAAAADAGSTFCIKVDNTALVEVKGYGKGILWIKGSAKTPKGSGIFEWKGLVYIGDDTNDSLVVSNGGKGSFWILGALGIKGDMVPWKNGGGGKKAIQVLYSAKSIDNNLEEHIGRFIILNWREEK